jgi:hypothetical protein
MIVPAADPEVPVVALVQSVQLMTEAPAGIATQMDRKSEITIPLCANLLILLMFTLPSETHNL